MGIPEQAEVPPVARAHGSWQVPNPPAQPPLPAQPAPVPSGGPNAYLLDLSPQGLPDMGSNAAGGGNLDFLRNNPEFQKLRAMVQADRRPLRAKLREMRKQNPQLRWLIDTHRAEFVCLINEPITSLLAPQASAARPTSTPVSAAPHPSATTLAPPALVTAPAPAAAPASAPASSVTDPSSDVYGEAASNLVAGNNLEGVVQEILDMGRGTWDRDTVVRALHAAFNNPDRAVDYLYSGIPEQAEVRPVARAHESGQVAKPPAQPAPVPSSGPNANLLDLSPQGLPNMGSNAAGGGNLDFLHNSPEAPLASATPPTSNLSP